MNDDGNVRADSAIVNLLMDFGADDGWKAYVGGDVGLANVRYKLDYTYGSIIGNGGDGERSAAYQGIAGVRKAVMDNV